MIKSDIIHEITVLLKKCDYVTLIAIWNALKEMSR